MPGRPGSKRLVKLRSGDYRWLEARQGYLERHSKVNNGTNWASCRIKEERLKIENAYGTGKGNDPEQVSKVIGGAIFLLAGGFTGVLWASGAFAGPATAIAAVGGSGIPVSTQIGAGVIGGSLDALAGGTSIPAPLLGQVKAGNPAHFTEPTFANFNLPCEDEE